MGLLDGKIAIVTGSAYGLGRQTALELASAGAFVVINDIGVQVDGSGEPDSSAAGAVVAEVRSLGGSAVAHHGDVGSWKDAKGLVDAAVDAYGRLDILVNNAGILRRGSMLDLDESDLDALIHVHLKGTLATMHHAGRYWRTEQARTGQVAGAVVNMTSRAGLEPRFAVLGWYGAIKSAIAVTTLAAATEFAAFAVRVNAVAPVAPTRMSAYTFEPIAGASVMAATFPQWR